jgi:hypothetical protein
VEVVTEVWKDIPGYEGRYQVSDLGRVRSLDHRVRLVSQGVETTRLSPGKILRPGPSPTGHLSVSLGKGNSKGVHTLVLLAFVGPRPEGQESLHLNHTPADNRLVNLRYGTRSENVLMDYETGGRVADLNHMRAMNAARWAT